MKKRVNRIIIKSASKLLLFLDNTEEERMADVNDCSSPSIFKLDFKCYQQLFTYLPLKDLHSLGQTCKKLHQCTGCYVHEHYECTEFSWENGNLCYKSEMNGFIEFISTLTIASDHLGRIAQFAPRFKSIKSLCLVLYGNRIDGIEEILQKCEKLETFIGFNGLTIDLYEKALKFCTNLKQFSLNPFVTCTSLVNNNWLLHEYPNLEYLDLYSESRAQPSVDAIQTFFTLNKGIRKFQANFQCLWNCRHWIVGTNIKLDELSVCFTFIMFRKLDREHIHFLKTLYERGFYKHLSLSPLELFNDDSSMLREFCSPLTLELNVCHSSLPPLDLKELRVQSTQTRFVNPEIILANNFSVIEQIHFHRLKTENVLTFVQKCIKLREMKIDFLDDVNSFDSVALNEERMKLVGARSVTIYLNKLDYNTSVKKHHCELVKIKILETP